ncbi:hypothetical protein LEMLEM_LOCUS20987, partial [Lemmus lemmus]
STLGCAATAQAQRLFWLEPGANAPLRLCWLLPLTFQVMNARD